MSKYLPKLIEHAQKTIPSIQADLATAANNPYRLRDICEQQLNVIAYLLHHVITEACAKDPAAAASLPAQTAAPAPRSNFAPVRRPVAAAPSPMPYPQHSNGMPRLPPPPDLVQPTASAPAGTTSTAGDAPLQAGVTNVTITPNGVTAVTPSGQRSVLPPGTPVPLEATMDLEPELPEAPEGVNQVILPPGGGMTPELEAALGSRSQEPPTP